MSSIKLDFDEYVLDIVEDASEKLGNSLLLSSVRWVDRPIGKDKVADTTLAFFVDGRRRRDDVVLIVSPSRFPDAVSNAMLSARTIANSLGPHTSQRILLPVLEGNFGAQSYALMPRLEPFSGGSTLKFFQKFANHRRILDWLCDVAAESRYRCKSKDDIQHKFVEPLTFISNEEDFSAELRSYSERCIRSISSEDQEKICVLQHGDFWFGNLLFDRRWVRGVGPFIGDFYVIDWGGAQLKGYPAIDTVRYCMSSINHRSARSRRCIADYADRMGLTAFEIGLHCVASLGYLGMNRNEFPKHRYISLAESVFGFLRSRGFV